MTGQRNSDVEWLGAVPSCWTVKKLGHLLRERPCYGVLVPDYDPDGVEMLRINDMTRGPIARTALLTISPKLSHEYSRSVVQEGDVIVSVVGTIGEALEINADLAGVNLSRAVARVQTKEELLASFLVWCFRSPTFSHYVDVTCVGTAQRVLNMADMTAFLIGTPPLPEQHAIAAFLDRETAKLDALVAEQERLIALLAEKRRAVVSHAVTKGLDPDAPMKDSGIEWLGEVPTHWEVVPVGYRYEVQLGKMLDAAKQTGKFQRPYLRVFDVQWGAINVDDLPMMDFDDEARDRYRLQDGDLLVNEGGSYVGRSAIWSGELDECYYQKALHRLRPVALSKDDTRFMFYVMRFATDRGVFVAGGNQTTIDHLTAEGLRQYRFAFPGLTEQSAIAGYLDRQMAKLDTLAAETERSIALLKERRAALISAAVTGKIDLREAVDAEEVAA